MHHITEQGDGGGVQDVQAAQQVLLPAAVRGTAVVAAVQSMEQVPEEGLGSAGVGIGQRAATRCVLRSRVTQPLFAGLQAGGQFTQRGAAHEHPGQHGHHMVIGVEPLAIAVGLVFAAQALHKAPGDQVQQLRQHRLSGKQANLAHVLGS